MAGGDGFIAKARPDKGNYGQGALRRRPRKLERAQIEQGREACLTGGASCATSASRARLDSSRRRRLSG